MISWLLVITPYLSHAQDFEKFKPKPADVAPMDSESLFSRATRAHEVGLTDCSYVVEQTKVASFQQEQFCNGIAIKFCFARIACTGHKRIYQDKYGGPTGKTVDRACPVVDGKCPAKAEDCLDSKGFVEVVSGKSALANAPSPAPSGGGANTGR